ncbi:MAG: prolipoprotein diacylglyceryl transferase [Gammaproteobacteria bacterium]|nr:prolipoprotein diacylglyceryl transferase [Gammaproteobacteria bacterium]
MIAYPQFDPVAFSLGPLTFRWYGLMYLIGFGLAWWLAGRRAQKEGSGWTREEVSDVIFYGALGVILGGRLGSVLFYNFDRFLQDPVMLFRVWEGGMSFHGGLIGVAIALLLFSRRYKKSFLSVTDFVSPLVPLGLFFGRIGNFINNELWGKPTDLPWGIMLVPFGPSYHPSQLYEAFLEGLVLFIILWTVSAKTRPAGVISGLFLLFYGIFRFTVEFVRMPDADLGYLALGWVTMGQILTIPMIAGGLWLISWARKQNENNA